MASTSTSAATTGTGATLPPAAARKTAAAPRSTAAKTAAAPADKSASSASRTAMLDRLSNSILELDLSDSDDLREFCEAVRKLLHFTGVTVAMASGQMTAHARRAARQDTDLDLRQRGVLRFILRKCGRKLNSAADHCGDAAANVVEAWSVVEEFIADVEAGGTGRMSRADRKERGAGGSFKINRK